MVLDQVGVAAAKVVMPIVIVMAIVMVRTIARVIIVVVLGVEAVGLVGEVLPFLLRVGLLHLSHLK